MKALETLLLACIAVFAPIKAAILTVVVLVIADLITGMLAAKKRGEKITSAGIKRTVGKVLLYETALCLGFIVQQYLTGDILPASKLVSAIIGLAELKSVLENLDSLSGTSLYKVLLSRIVSSQQTLEKSDEEKDQ